MRINKFVASASGLSRRAADKAIEEGRVKFNQQMAQLGDSVGNGDIVQFDDKVISLPDHSTTIILNKPVGYVCSRDGQGSLTVYDLLPPEYWHLKPVGRLDKNSCGLLLMTNDGDLANQLTHPSHAKTKVYEVSLDKALQPLHHQMINDKGIQLADGISRLSLAKFDSAGNKWQVTMAEGRNRQVRRTFDALGYTVTQLERLSFGPYKLGDLSPGSFILKTTTI